ncbi:hypothetical protein LTR66_016755 [Elasticomyces elasticus]|nr:hypothetical protein LTR66_016755 [Elasticomyces elasticus]
MVLAKFRNSGQTCVTANRIYVQSGVYDKFVKAVTEKVKTLKVGCGTEEGVFVGPLTHERAVEKAMNHIKDAKKHGGQVVLGGKPYDDGGRLKGYFIEPTIITGMKKEAITTREETFAPVLALYRFDTEEEVLELANDCDVGLGGFIITESIPRMWRLVEALEVGMVGVNLGLLSACESPFGGVRASGYGREGGKQGIEEYMTVKSMLINVSNG